MFTFVQPIRGQDNSLLKLLTITKTHKFPPQSYSGNFWVMVNWSKSGFSDWKLAWGHDFNSKVYMPVSCPVLVEMESEIWPLKGSLIVRVLLMMFCSFPVIILRVIIDQKYVQPVVRAFQHFSRLKSRELQGFSKNKWTQICWRD